MRNPAVLALLTLLICAYVEVIIATLRWRRRGVAPLLESVESNQGMIVLFWHGRIAHAMACRPLLGKKPRSVMISLSRDGGFIARAATRLGFPPIRGSTGRPDATLDKRGAGALRDAVGALRRGEAMLLTPDGPRGPREAIQIGAIQLARVARCPVFVLGFAARPSWALNSWDGGSLPLPFARAAMVVEGPLSAPRLADAAALEATRAEWEARLRRAQVEAEALLARR